MKRWGRRILAYLLLGALANVLVAWGCVLWAPLHTRTLPPDPVGSGYPSLVEGPQGQRGWWMTSEGRGWRNVVSWRARGGNGYFRYWHGTGVPAHTWAGWPLLSLRSVVRPVTNEQGQFLRRWDLPWQEIMRRGVHTNDLPPWMRANGGRRLPLVPVWWAFAVNTLFYAAVVAGIHAAGRSLRGRLARWRADRLGYPECSGCGYNLTGLPTDAPCPECGRRRSASARPVADK